jgi:hypothetical protein
MTPSKRSTDRRNRRSRRFSLEPLEGRTLMSLGAEFPTTINTTIRNAQFGSVNASSSNGSAVAVWVDTFSATDHDIRAQRFNSAGAKVGSEIIVTDTTLDEDQPSVAMDGSGNFVVSWRVTLASGDTNVLAQRFNASGTKVGAVVQVGVGTFKESSPSVGMDNLGNFVVVYTRDTNNNNPDIFAKKYNSANQLTNVINVDVTSDNDDSAKVAMTPDGRFDVVYEDILSPQISYIILKQFSATGGLNWTGEPANSNINEVSPSISIDNSGNAVVAWQDGLSNGVIFASRESASGNIGSQMFIEHATVSEIAPSVALKRTGGAFVVTYFEQLPGFINATHVAEVSASNQVTVFSAGNRVSPAVSINGAGQYLVTYTSNDSGDLNIRGRLGHLS